jgi:2,4-dienoyl-CoA reductase-like NADH-dependent reductase (Old Yellow Enzyme family)
MSEKVHVPPLNNSFRAIGERLPLLFRPLKIKKVTFKNRIVLSPMCQYSSVDGFIQDWHIAHLGQYAIQGIGLIFVEATAVQPRGRITPDDLGIWKDDHIPKLRQLTDFIRSQGSRSGIQLAHAGRKASCLSPFLKQGFDKLAARDQGGWEDKIIAPSPLKVSHNSGEPCEAQLYDIGNIVYDFGEAARRAYLAGFDVVEIHAAHGYLIHSFLSPISNKRTDNYGGSFENRVRILAEILEQVRKNWDRALPIFVRLSCEDLVEGGWTIEETVRLAAILKDLNVDLIDCSSGGIVPSPNPRSHEEGWNVSYSRAVIGTGILSGVVGGITDPLFAEKILRNGEASMIFIGRELLRNPCWVKDAAAALEVDLEYPIQYNRAKIVS